MTTQTCSEFLRSTDRYTSFHPEQCSRPAVVQAKDSSGKLQWFCTLHNPDTVKARQKKRDESTCHKRVYGRYCHKPAVEIDPYGYGMCQAHSLATIEAKHRLEAAAPALLEAVQALMEAFSECYKSDHGIPSMHIAMIRGQAAIEQTKGRSA